MLQLAPPSAGIGSDHGGLRRIAPDEVGVAGELLHAAGKELHCRPGGQERHFRLEDLLGQGAQRGQVVGQVLGLGLKLAVLGGTLGVVAGWLLSRTLERLLFEVSPHDPLTFGFALTVLVAAS